MIASVAGRVGSVSLDGVVVEVAGVGVALQCTPDTMARLRVGEPARLATSLVVREDSLTLFGFVDDDERSLFELLQTASGVGPRLALAILAVHRPAEVRRAICAGDLVALTRVPGIGKKGAERLVLELRDRIGPVESSEPAPAAGPAVEPAWRGQLRQALIGLGWSTREADDGVTAVAPQPTDPADPAPQPDVAVLLRRAIQLLGRR